jgi:hypothetical protein
MTDDSCPGALQLYHRYTCIIAIDKISVQRFSLQKLWIKHILILLHCKAITEQKKSFMQTHDRNPLSKYATQSQRTGIWNISECTNKQKQSRHIQAPSTTWQTNPDVRTVKLNPEMSILFIATQSQRTSGEALVKWHNTAKNAYTTTYVSAYN